MGLATLLMLGSAPAGAQDRAAVASLSCRRQCATQVPGGTAGERAMQVCLLRCAAGERHLLQQRRPGTPEATGRGAAPGVPDLPRRTVPAGRSLVVYAGTLPQVALTISRPVERAAAHRGAEQECFRSNGNRPCRLLLETEERCIAVAQAVRAVGLVVTRDPRTYTVVHYGAGSGATLAAAREAAARDCGGRLAPDTHCRIAAARCG
jgi:hypothetical protein